MKYVITILVLLLLPFQAFAAIAFDNSCVNSTNTSVSPETCTFTLAAGADEAVACVGNGNPDNTNITSVTLGGVNMTKHADIPSSDGYSLTCWTLDNPPTGSKQLSVAFSSSNIRFSTTMSYTGALGGYEGVSNSSFVTYDGTGAWTATSSALVANSWTIGCFSGDGSAAASTGVTDRSGQISGSDCGDSGAAVSATSMKWNGLGVSGKGAYTIIAISPTAVSNPFTYNASNWWSVFF
jgi:hypothetical protein